MAIKEWIQQSQVPKSYIYIEIKCIIYLALLINIIIINTNNLKSIKLVISNIIITIIEKQ